MMLAQIEFPTERLPMARMTETEQNEWKIANIDLLCWLLSQENPHEFLADMVRAVKTYGALTPKQTAAVAKWQANSNRAEEIANEEKAKAENLPALIEGRRILTGDVISTKWHDGSYGTTLKMVVRLEDGNKVWGTVPANIEPIEADNLIGKRVSFSATVKRSDRDPHFGFFSRPKDARFVD
jgi:hypothetical protein